MINLLMLVITMMLHGCSSFEFNDGFVGGAFTKSLAPSLICKFREIELPVGLPFPQEPDKVTSEIEAGFETIALTEGIVGGFIPPHVRLKIIFLPGSDGVEIWIKSQPDRTAKSRYLKGTISIAEFDDLKATIQDKQLWNLPVELPRGSQDIYQLDTGLDIRLQKRSWSNGGPEGCVHGKSEIQASDEQRKIFRQLVELIKRKANQHARTQVEAKFFESAEKKLSRPPDQEQQSPTRTIREDNSGHNIRDRQTTNQAIKEH